ncbi:heterokaryon incompatibility protein-domain-containing protein [Echria macrotheca]|uniref:Heterokaryon incompatibility protein-domain-containing protein n=1 Tax=Echria macrotheca TaxID=438768 RepID=A0AAJ0B6D7_9PEZI|nr:heterokaryon incompatibility protein-domain-containing protein [Echria macrotheca]
MGPYPEEHKPRYEYQPITAPNTVRLLKIEPRLFRLRCSLVEHHLDAKDAAPFDAISYRWGASSEKTKVLDFGGKILPIPASAHEIIWNRASLWRTRLMWIDAICIDQEDQNDKNQQVGLMRDIYNKADRTIVWLGEAPDVVLAFNFLNEMLVQINLSKDNLELATMGLKRINDANPKWAALKRMLENPYWSRVWIVQEIVASRKVHIRYGGLWFDWDLFAPIVKELYTDSSSGLLQKLDLAEGMATPPFLAVHRIHSIESMRADYQTGVRWALAPVLINFAVSQSTLDKDHIFAFQGISSAVEDGALTPDYGKPALDIFREAVLYSLHRSRFMILSMAGMSHTRASVPDWPSWVPDFQAVSGLEPQLATALHTYAPYRASGICWPIVFAPEGSNEVTIRGFVVDEIVALTQLPPPDRSLWRGFGEVHSEDEKASVTMVLQDVGRFREAQELVESRLPPTYFNGQTRWDAFWRTYLGNKSTTSYPAEDDYGDRLRGFMDTQERVILALAFIVGDGHLKLSKEQCHNLRQAALGDRKVTDAANTSHIGLLVGCTMGQRRVAVTRKGFLALAPKDAREGDLVSIFAGGKVPYVLRRAAGQGAGTEKYRLVGEGYLHGFMDGEIWASQVGLQEIVLV